MKKNVASFQPRIQISDNRRLVLVAVQPRLTATNYRFWHCRWRRRNGTPLSDCLLLTDQVNLKTWIRHFFRQNITRSAIMYDRTIRLWINNPIWGEAGWCGRGFGVQQRVISTEFTMWESHVVNSLEVDINCRILIWTFCILVFKHFLCDTYTFYIIHIYIYTFTYT